MALLVAIDELMKNKVRSLRMNGDVSRATNTSFSWASLLLVYHEYMRASNRPMPVAELHDTGQVASTEGAPSTISTTSGSSSSSSVVSRLLGQFPHSSRIILYYHSVLYYHPVQSLRITDSHMRYVSIRVLYQTLYDTPM